MVRTARSAAAESHTWGFPAWNLRSTFNLRFHHQRWSSRRSRGQQPETSPTSSSTTSNCCTTQGQCSQLYFSLERKSYLTFSPCDSLGQNFGSILQSYYRQTINFFVYLVLNCQSCIDCSTRIASTWPDSDCGISAHTVASLKQTLHNYLRKPSMVGKQE